MRIRTLVAAAFLAGVPVLASEEAVPVPVGWAGRDLDNFSYQLDFAYPIRTKFLDIESFVLVQYFNGYGESQFSYDKKSDALRVGLALLR